MKQAIIMAGGKGTRLRPYTNILPKPLLPIGLKSIIDVNIKQLASNGFNEIVIAVGYLGEIIESVIGNGDKYNVKISYYYEEKPMGTVGALSLIQGLQDCFIVMNGDILHNLDFNSLYKYHTNNHQRVTIGTFNHIYQVPLGVLDIEDGVLQNYIEKPKTKYKISMGMYVFDRLIVENYINDKKFLDFPTLINTLINDRIVVDSYNHHGLWIDLGTPEQYLNLINGIDDILKKYPEVPITI